MVGRLNDNIASNPEEDDEALLGSRIDMSDIFKHISVVYVDALRDVLREMKTIETQSKESWKQLNQKYHQIMLSH